MREELIERDRNYYLIDSLLEANVPVLTYKLTQTPHEDRLPHQGHQGGPPVCLTSTRPPSSRSGTVTH